MAELREIDWDTIRVVWEEKLWPGRKSPIEPVSSMLYLGGYDLSIKHYPPFFLGIYLSGELVAVNSGVRTSKKQYRSRGLWVAPEARGNSFGKMLLNHTAAQGMEEGCETIWSIPRKSAMNTYEAAGFIATTPYFDEDMEFGPNCYALASLRSVGMIAQEARILSVFRQRFYDQHIDEMRRGGASIPAMRARMQELAENEDKMLS